MSKLVDNYKLTISVLAMVLVIIYFAFNPLIRRQVVLVEPDMQSEGKVRLELKGNVDYLVYVSLNPSEKDRSLRVNGIPVDRLFDVDMEVKDDGGHVIFKADTADWFNDPVSLGRGRNGINVIDSTSYRKKPLRLDADGVVTLRWALKPMRGDDDVGFYPDCALYFTANVREWIPRRPVLIVD